ncbi:NAD(P)/FAD-dependent oxidoreductase [Propioniciclava coleopterorum]|uniref:NAD(P)/FAD-dependent oxidoreductase n=1 Tax=Propioniciclava coleopterorum TaxID=2714937 RepID=A0A6G7Y2S1_9ACTN|nr:FAD/NAD(P)-binding oxidoreductase [Propioniciclava coleopterorum]QIK71073.1 NAD(P)/FAD-dependent oxidoreductase [Propioniciclava coleopterorum]
MTRYVIIGGGLGGAKAAEALRDLDGSAEIVLLSGERHLPYERPPLSKEFLQGTKTLTDATVFDAGWYRDNEITLKLGAFATSVDAGQRIVELSDGTNLSYDGLVLATGSRPRSLPLPGIARPGVQTLRTIEEATELREAILALAADGRRLLIIGGGWISLEVAASARTLGAEVTVIARDDRILPALGREWGERFARLHREHGVDLRLSAQVARVDGDGDTGPVSGVTLTDGTTIDGGHLLIAVGADPRLELADLAGVDLDDGVLVGPGLVSSDPAITAVGDIANVENTFLGHRERLQHWAAALKEPDFAARSLVGDASDFDDIPYFFTDQYDWGMEFRGEIPASHRLVQRGPEDAGITFWLDADGVPRAAMNLNVWDDGDAIEAILRARRPVDGSALADEERPLTEFA